LDRTVIRMPVGNTRKRVRACGLSLLLGIVALTSAAGAAPYRPTDDAEVLERLPTAGDASLRQLRRLHADLAQQPQNLRLALRVAAADIDVARTRSDPRYNGYAEAALGPWLAAPNPPPAVLVLRATLRQSRHDFAAALSDLDAVLAADPRNAQARLTRAVILQVEGDYTEALGSCLSLALLAETLVTETCAQSVRSLNGNAKAARERLEAALDRASPAANAQVRLWALTVLGEIDARLGDGEKAERSFRAALSLGRDSYLLGAYADFLLDAGRPEEVVTLLREDALVDPLLLRLALAEQRLGMPALQSHVADLSERFAANRRRGDTSHRREEARFALHLLKDPAQALRLAEANWAQQREPWDARILLEAALAAETPRAARPVLDWLARVHLEDGHVGALAAKLASAAP
jgi:Tfp pilus assembly protein PilF